MAEAMITFTDPASLSDLGRYAARARALDEDAAVTLQTSPGPDGRTVLAAYVGVLPGSGLLSEGLVLGLRTFEIEVFNDPDGGAALDLSVPAAAITDRTAHSPGERTLPIPPTRVHPTWSSITPPRSGWEYAGTVSADDVAAVARDGLEQISAAVRERGAAAGFTKTQVWEAEVTFNSDDPEAAVTLHAGVTLAAYALGFLTPGGEARVFRTNRWTRVSGPGGHVLAR